MRSVTDEIDPAQVSLLKYRCGGCRMVLQIASLPWSPRIAKHRCPQCETVNEIAVRDSAMDPVREHVGEGKDMNRVAKRHSAYASGDKRHRHEDYEREKKRKRRVLEEKSVKAAAMRYLAQKKGWAVPHLEN